MTGTIYLFGVVAMAVYLVLNHKRIDVELKKENWPPYILSLTYILGYTIFVLLGPISVIVALLGDLIEMLEKKKL